MKTEAKSKLEILKEATQKRYELISITGGRNGYPVPELGYGVIGFDTYEEAETFAKQYDADEIAMFYKKYGWNCYEYKGYQNCEIDMFSDIAKKEVIYQSKEDAANYINEYYAEKIKEIDDALVEEEDSLFREELIKEKEGLLREKEAWIAELDKVDFSENFITIDLTNKYWAIEAYPITTMIVDDDSNSEIYVVGCYFSNRNLFND